MTVAVLCSMPPVVFYYCLRRQLVAALAAGAVSDV